MTDTRAGYGPSAPRTRVHDGWAMLPLAGRYMLISPTGALVWRHSPTRRRHPASFTYAEALAARGRDRYQPPTEGDPMSGTIIAKVHHRGGSLGTRNHVDLVVESGFHRLAEGTRWELRPLRDDVVPSARSTDPDTSHEAADSVKDPTAVQWQILAHLANEGPATDELICRLMRAGETDEEGHPLGPTPQSVRSRRAELVRLGLVVEADRDGRTAARRPSIRWKPSRIATNRWSELRHGMADPTMPGQLSLMNFDESATGLPEVAADADMELEVTP